MVHRTGEQHYVFVINSPLVAFFDHITKRVQKMAIIVQKEEVKKLWKEAKKAKYNVVKCIEVRIGNVGRWWQQTSVYTTTTAAAGGKWKNFSCKREQRTHYRPKLISKSISLSHFSTCITVRRTKHCSFKSPSMDH